MLKTEQRVDRLEKAHQEFTRKTGVEFSRVYSLIERLGMEMKVFKDEMRVFKNEMGDFKGDTANFKAEMRNEHIRMNKQWGEISNKLGTLVEDIVAPSVPRIIKERYDLEPKFSAVRVKKKREDGAQKEFDMIAVAGDFLFLNSTKSTLKIKDVEELSEDIKIIRSYFPEYNRKKIVGLLASLRVDESVLKYAEKAGYFVLGVGEELMEVLNRNGFKPKEW